MAAAFLRAALLFGGLLFTAPAAVADQPSFGDLLARAKAQSAAGHRLSPAGDNVAETVAVMMTMISSATPSELEELAAVLQPGKPPAEDTRLEVPPAPAIRLPVPRQDSGLLPRSISLFARGQQAEQAADFSAARRFYSSAAELGHAGAARAMGRLYDPAFLKQKAVGGLDADPLQARVWYERAITLGDAEAAPLLQALSSR